MTHSIAYVQIHVKKFSIVPAAEAVISFAHFICNFAVCPVLCCNKTYTKVFFNFSKLLLKAHQTNGV